MEYRGRRGPSPGDLAVAAGMAVVALTTQALVPVAAPYRATDWQAVVPVLFAAAVLVWRRTWPVLSVAGTGLAVVVLVGCGYQVGVLPWATWIAVYTCFSARGALERAAAIVVSVSGIAGYVALDRDRFDLMNTLGAVLPMVMAALAGEAVRTRRAYVEELEARNAALERARALAARQLLLQERARLARELHDAVGHAVNVMVMQAGVADRVFDTNPGYGREALRSIADTGREAIVELDSLLGLLAPEGEADPEAVTGGPSLDDLPAMIRRLREAGRPVEASIRADVDQIPARVGRVAYRILQEAMTNAARHAGVVPIAVSVAVESGWLRLAVRDEGGACGPVVPGRGLVNMAERSRMLGGTFEAGPVAGGFQVCASLPLGDGGAG